MLYTILIHWKLKYEMLRLPENITIRLECYSYSYDGMEDITIEFFSTREKFVKF